MKLRDWLHAHNKTHEAFAAETGLGRTAVTRYANGKRRPGIDALRAIARATGGAVTANDFLDVEPDGDAGGPAGAHREPAAQTKSEAA